jgi:hypothetical protein
MAIMPILLMAGEGGGGEEEEKQTKVTSPLAAWCSLDVL